MVPLHEQPAATRKSHTLGNTTAATALNYYISNVSTPAAATTAVI